MWRSVRVLAIVTLFAACDDSPSDPPPDPPQQLEWTASLDGLTGWEHLEGEASVTWTEGTSIFSATAEIENDDPGAVRPWHVHVNTCAAGGGIHGADGDYPRLEVGADSTATATANVSLALDSLASYHVNVHLSEAEMGVFIACGDLVRTGGG